MSATRLFLSLPIWLAAGTLAAAQPYEGFFFIADGVDAEQVKACRLMLVAEITTACPGTVLHVVRCEPTFTTVATLVVPKGSPNARLRDQVNSVAWRKIGREIVARPGASQLNLPEAPARIAEIRSTELRDVRVVLCGTPIYHSEQHAGFSFVGGWVPSDGALKANNVCPFATEVGSFGGARVSWITSATWGEDHVHRSRAIRFYQRFFDLHDGRLVRVTSNPADALRLDPPQFTSVPQAEDEDTVMMKRWVVGSRRTEAETEESPAIERETIPEAVDTPARSIETSAQSARRVIDTATADPHVTALAIQWESTDPGADIDLHVTDRRSGETLFWRNTSTSFGQLFRDVRDVQASEDLQRWESCQIEHDRVWELDVWLHSFSAAAPSRVRLVGVWRGQRREAVIALPASSNGDPRADKTDANGWRKVSLMSRPPKLAANDNAASTQE
jgi:hypothetical protein